MKTTNCILPKNAGIKTYTFIIYALVSALIFMRYFFTYVMFVEFLMCKVFACMYVCAFIHLSPFCAESVQIYKVHLSGHLF